MERSFIVRDHGFTSGFVSCNYIAGVVCHSSCHKLYAVNSILDFRSLDTTLDISGAISLVAAWMAFFMYSNMRRNPEFIYFASCCRNSSFDKLWNRVRGVKLFYRSIVLILIKLGETIIIRYFGMLILPMSFRACKIAYSSPVCTMSHWKI